MRDSNYLEIPRFLGQVNTYQNKRQPVGGATLLSSKNVDVTDSGAIVMRNGYAPVLAQAGMTWAYATQVQTLAVFIANGNLYQFNDNGTSKLLKSGVDDRDTFQTEIAGVIYTNTGMIISENAVNDLRIPNPPMPSVTVAQGNLPAGLYMVTATVLSDDGRESGSSEVGAYEVAEDGGGLNITASGCRIYVTKADDTVFFYAGDDSVVYSEFGEWGYRLNQMNLNTYPMPENADKIGFYQAKLFCSVYDQIQGMSFVFYSKPFFPHLWDLERDYIAVQGEVRMLCATKEVLLIGSDNEVNAWDGTSLVNLADYGVPKGEVAFQRLDGVVEFWTLRGMCRAMPFENLTQQNVSVNPGDYCSVMHFEQNGFDRLVVCTDLNGNANNQLFAP